MTASNKLSRIIAVFLCLTLAIGTILFLAPRENVSAAGSVSVNNIWSSGDKGGFHLKVSGYSSGNNVDVILKFNCTVYASFSGKAVQVLSDGSSKLKLRIKGWNGDDGSPNNNDYYVSLSGTNLATPLKITVSDTTISRTPTPKPTKATTKKTNPTSSSSTTKKTTPTSSSTKKTTPSSSTTKKTNPTSSSSKSSSNTHSTTTEHKSNNKKKTSSNKKTSSDKKIAAPKNNSSKKKTVKHSSATKATTETTDNKIMLAAVGKGEGTTTNPSDPTEEDGPSNAALSHNNLEKNLRSFKWLWFVLLLTAAGLSYLRIRKLKNDGKQGKDLLLDFIPGVGDLVYAYAGSSKKYAPIASDAQHGYSYNPAIGKKEIKQIDEEAEKAEKSVFKPATAHAPIKRPKELSVNRAAFVAEQKEINAAPSAAASAFASGLAAASTNEKPAAPFAAASVFAPAPAVTEEKEDPADTVAASVEEKKEPAASFASTPVFAPASAAASADEDEDKPAQSVTAAAFMAGLAAKTENNKNDSPFKQLDGISRPKGIDPNAVFKTEVSHTTDDIMTSAFKPTEGSHTTDKIVTSAFKPIGTSHTSEKIVTSAVKQSSKFTPQRGPSAPKTVKTADSESIRLARERAEAAREQQAMRAAMRTGKSVAEVKGEAKPAQRGPVSRPSAFGTNRPAATATNKPEFNPMVVPQRTKSAPTNSNQLGNMLKGRAYGQAATTPVWASPASSINPFGNSGAAKEDASTAAGNNASAQTSIADQAESAKPAYFSRGNDQEGRRDDTVYSANSFGVRANPGAVLAEDKHVRDTRYKQAKGSLLEGQKSAIANPDQYSAPTATQPVFGFKPIDPSKAQD